MTGANRPSSVINLADLFSDVIQCTVPPYQRNYVWRQTKWDQLWKDIVDVLERRVPKHFVGMFVLQDLGWVAGRPAQLFVVDGQQRLMTLHILNVAIREAARRLGIQTIVDQSRRLSFNAAESADFVNKLEPSLVDRADFRAVVQNPVGIKDTDQGLASVYRFFAGRIQRRLRAAEDQRVALLDLFREVTQSLTFAVITLDRYDDPQSVYERINSAGEPLHPAHLIRNHVLHVCERSGIPLDGAYATYWEHFDTDADWQAAVHRTTSSETFLDVFLRSFLIVETGQAVEEQNLFVKFRKYIDRKVNDLFGVLGRMRDLAERFRSLRTMSTLGPLEQQFIERMQASQVYSFMPVVLKLFGLADAKKRLVALRVIESYVLRRIICDRTATGYTDMQPAMLKAVDATEPGPALARYLADRPKSTAWPTDREVIAAVATWQAYSDKPLDQRRNRVARELLILIERTLTGRMIEPIDTSGMNVNIEHLMPQGWTENLWPVTGATEVERAAERERRSTAINTLGNLTLLTPDLNSYAGNRAWQEKFDKVTELSRLLLNKELPESFPDTAAIAARGARLAEILIDSIPGPASAVSAGVPMAGPASTVAVGVSDPATAGIDDTNVVDEAEDVDEVVEEELNNELSVEAEAAVEASGDFTITPESEEATVPVSSPSAGGAQASTAVSNKSAHARVRTVLKDAGGGPLTYREIADATGLQRNRVWKDLRFTRINGVRTVTKDGVLAGELWDRRGKAMQSP